MLGARKVTKQAPTEDPHIIGTNIQNIRYHGDLVPGICAPLDMSTTILQLLGIFKANSLTFNSQYKICSSCRVSANYRFSDWCLAVC